jgi:coenzyme F420-0:L-glutamate ligase/coenzyme F420-1:gamma-L-glutamate ligase
VATHLHVFAVPGIPEITQGTDPGDVIGEAVVRAHLPVQAGDVFVVAQKLVSKAEGALIALAEIAPSTLAREWAAEYGKDAAFVEVVLRESRRLVRMDRGIIIAETRHGLVCANAGVDASNVPPGYVTILPRDPDASAARLRDALVSRLGCPVAAIVSDTFGRPWREGVVNVALGVAGLRPLEDCRGRSDAFGRPLQSTVIAVADELASAAELVMTKTARVPVAIVRGAIEWAGDGDGSMLIRPPAMELFR